MSVRQGGNVIAGVAKGDKFPAGIIAPFAGTAIPDGWLLCDGSAISRTDYADLFNAIGTTYGAGNGSSTFNLPNLIGRVPLGMQGVYIGQTSNGVLPNITGTFYIDVYGGGQPTGAFTRDSNYNVPNHQNWAAEGWRMVLMHLVQTQCMVMVGLMEHGLCHLQWG